MHFTDLLLCACVAAIAVGKGGLGLPESQPLPTMSAWLAANSGDKQALATELDQGADIEYKDPMGRTGMPLN